MPPEKRHTRDHHGRFPCLPDDGCRTSPEKRHSQNPTLAQHVQATREANPPHAEAQVRKSDRFGALRAPCGRKRPPSKGFQPHRSSSAPETGQKRPKSTAQSPFRARTDPNSCSRARIHRTKPFPRQERAEFAARSRFRAGGMRKSQHKGHSAPKRSRILAREPESTARSFFRAKNAPKPPHGAPNAPSGRRSWRRARNGDPPPQR